MEMQQERKTQLVIKRVFEDELVVVASAVMPQAMIDGIIMALRTDPLATTAAEGVVWIEGEYDDGELCTDPPVCFTLADAPTIMRRIGVPEEVVAFNLTDGFARSWIKSIHGRMYPPAGFVKTA